MSLVALALLGGCAGAAPQARPAPLPDANQAAAEAREPAPLAVAVEALPDAGWQTREFLEQRFSVPLPDARRWRLEADPRWLSLRHEPSRSRLQLRVWTAGPTAKKEECLQQLYLWRGDLRPHTAPIVERRLSAPGGYDVALRVDLLAESPKTAVAVAYGATLRRCYAAVFETSVDTGDDAELGVRLRLVVDGVLNHVDVIGIEQRALGM